MQAHIDFMKKALGAVKDRGPAYGDIEENFGRAAAIASLWLDKPITPRDIVLIIASVKMARIALAPGHQDSFVDLCNYVAFGAAFSRQTGNGMDENALAGDLDASLKAEINGA